MRINRALYGIEYMGNSWHKALSTTSSSMNIETSRADPDIWLRMSTNSRREIYRECIVVYVENLLEIRENPEAIMDSFSMYD